jgi:hypothetical protein
MIFNLDWENSYIISYSQVFWYPLTSIVLLRVIQRSQIWLNILLSFWLLTKMVVKLTLCTRTSRIPTKIEPNRCLWLHNMIVFFFKDAAHYSWWLCFKGYLDNVGPSTGNQSGARIFKSVHVHAHCYVFLASSDRVSLYAESDGSCALRMFKND